MPIDWRPVDPDGEYGDELVGEVYAEAEGYRLSVYPEAPDALHYPGASPWYAAVYRDGVMMAETGCRTEADARAFCEAYATDPGPAPLPADVRAIMDDVLGRDREAL